METVISAVIILFLILFAVLTLGEASLSGQQAVYTTWQELPQAEVADLDILNVEIINDGEVIMLTLHNAGNVALADFETWDAIVQYYDASGYYHIKHLPYAEAGAISDEWTITGIYTDATFDIAETFDPSILNPGEEMHLAIHLVPAVGMGEGAQIALSSEGTQASITTHRNILPTLTTHHTLVINPGEDVIITSSILEVTDNDNAPEELTYIVSTSPKEGSLRFDTTFTQAMVNSGLVTYQHNGGTNDDEFMFVVSDGVNEIGPYIFEIEINTLPYLTVNNSAMLSLGSTVIISNTALAAMDNDNIASEITYRVIVPPVQGNLSLGSSFTQEQIDAGLLTYTHIGIGIDQFTFTLSDGSTEIGPYTFYITLL